jgi:hypothetical protein
LGFIGFRAQLKKNFVANVIQVEMQRYHLYIVRHATRAANETFSYQAKQKIVDNDMV